jgi:hypothetical protein
MYRILFLLLFFCCSQLNAGWLTGWGARKPLTIQGNTGEIEDYQVNIVVHKTTGTDSGKDVYIGNKCQNDFDDLRFTTNNGTTNLYWYREGYVSGTTASVWVKFSTIPASPGTIKYYMYYDSSEVATSSDIANTYLMYIGTQGASAVNSTTTISYGNNLRLRSSWKCGTSSNVYCIIAQNGSSNYTGFQSYAAGNALRCYYKQTQYYTNSPYLQNRETTEVLIYNSADNINPVCKWYRNESLYYTYTGSNQPISSGTMNLRWGWQSGAGAYHYWSTAAKFFPPEPTISLWGSEETHEVASSQSIIIVE